MVVSWERHWKLTLNSLTGTGSRTQVDDFILLIATLIASSVILWNDTLGGGSWTERYYGVVTAPLALLPHTVSIILFNNSNNSSLSCSGNNLVNYCLIFYKC